MLALHHRVYMVKPSGNADATHYFGHHIHSKDYTDRKRSLDQEKKKVTTPLCKLWHYEMIRTIERLRWCFLSSRHCDITRPNNWGVTTKAHSDLITSKLFVDNVKPVINKRKIPTRSKVNALYAKEKTSQLKVTKGDQFPALHPRPSLLLDVKKYAEWLLQEVLPSGTLGSKAWNANALKLHRHLLPSTKWSTTKEDMADIEKKKKRLIHAHYWCDLVRERGSWMKTMIPLSEYDVRTFKKECSRLYKLRIPRGLRDVLGDGNCLYYCMLDFLHEVDDRIALRMENEYPLVWLRKLLKKGATGINDQYWIGIGGCDREERINFLYDHHSFNVMDDVITRDAENVDHQGDIMSAVIFTCLFKVCVVIYQTTKPLMTYLLDG